MRRKVLQKTLSGIICLSLGIGLLSGCGKEAETKSLEDMNKKELLSTAYDYKNKYEQGVLDLADARQVLSSIDAYGNSGPIIQALSIDEEGMSFNSYDSKMIFPSAFSYPASTELAGTSTVEIAPNITIKATENWLNKLNGSSLEIEHTTGISGLIKMGYIQELYNKDNLQKDVLVPWFSSLTNTQVTYSNIFLDDTMWGVQAKAPILIDGENAYLRAGMIGFSNYSMTYVFVYRGEIDMNKEESIKNLLNSVTFLGLNMNVE